jgi:hypothetical protein
MVAALVLPATVQNAASLFWPGKRSVASGALTLDGGIYIPCVATAGSGVLPPSPRGCVLPNSVGCVKLVDELGGRDARAPGKNVGS